MWDADKGLSFFSVPPPKYVGQIFAGLFPSVERGRKHTWDSLVTNERLCCNLLSCFVIHSSIGMFGVGVYYVSRNEAEMILSAIK